MSLISGRRAARFLLASIPIASGALAQSSPPNTIQVALEPGDTFQAHDTMTVRIEGKNTGASPTLHHPVTILRCELLRSLRKDAKGKWVEEAFPFACSQATHDVVRFGRLEPGASETLSVPINAGATSCAMAAVVQHKPGQVQVPATAAMAPYYVTNVAPVSNATLASSIDVQQVLDKKKKPTSLRRITVDYTVTTTVAPAHANATVTVAVCRDPRCFLKATQKPDSFTFVKEKVGSTWVNKHVAKGRITTEHTLAKHDLYAGVPNEVRVALVRAAPTSQHLITRRCDAPAFVQYAPLK
ncbi:MAG: hypothetical protein KF718_12780 [Polyangiaceae bacterium]|nr:hypothetical protein [Polyangiaceae bacterium]